MFKRRLRCSFCYRSEAEVAKLVAGPRVYICDVCAEEVNRIMGDPTSDPSRPATTPVESARTFWAKIRSWLRSMARSRIDYLVTG